VPKKVSFTLSDSTHAALVGAAGGRSAGAFLREVLESKGVEGVPGLYDDSFDERIGRIVDAKLKAALARDLKDQTLVELETAERVAERAIKWGRIAGVFLAVPAAIFAILFSFLGVKTYFDLRDVAAKISDSEKTIELAKEVSDQSQATSRELIDRTDKLRTSVTEAEALVSRLRNVEARQRGLEEQVRTIEGRVKLGSFEQDLEAPLRQYLDFLDGVGFPKSETEIVVTKTDSVFGNVVYNPKEGTILVGREFWNSLGSIFSMYTNHALESSIDESDSGGSAPVTLKTALADYYASSFLDDPRIGFGADGSVTGGKGFLRNLDNERPYSDLSIGESSFDHSEVWGGLFWKVREILGKDHTDRILLQIWSNIPVDLTEKELYVWFAASLYEATIAVAAVPLKSSLADVWLLRGFPTTPDAGERSRPPN
jgi:hypothetical protein